MAEPRRKGMDIKMKVWRHFKTITTHKCMVLKYCFRVGLYKQGLLHDLSKYTFNEFIVGCRYYQGNRSPNNAEREAMGYSSAWLHHKGRNKHHYEYWMDYGAGKDKNITGMKMPKIYVAEMMMDRIAASRVYQGKNYTDNCPLEYYELGKAYYIIHPETRQQLEMMLHMLAELGEEALLYYVKKVYLKIKT